MEQQVAKTCCARVAEEPFHATGLMPPALGFLTLSLQRFVPSAEELLVSPLRVPGPEATSDHGPRPWTEDAVDLPQALWWVAPEENRPPADHQVHTTVGQREALRNRFNGHHPASQPRPPRRLQTTPKSTDVRIDQKDRALRPPTQGQPKTATSTAQVHPDACLRSAVLLNVLANGAKPVGQFPGPASFLRHSRHTAFPRLPLTRAPPSPGPLLLAVAYIVSLSIQDSSAFSEETPLPAPSPRLSQHPHT